MLSFACPDAVYYLNLNVLENYLFTTSQSIKCWTPTTYLPTLRFFLFWRIQNALHYFITCLYFYCLHRLIMSHNETIVNRITFQNCKIMSMRIENYSVVFWHPISDSLKSTFGPPANTRCLVHEKTYWPCRFFFTSLNNEFLFCVIHAFVYFIFVFY